VPRSGSSVKERNPAFTCHSCACDGALNFGFLATGTFQREIGDRSGISQPTFSRTMPAVLAAMKSFFPYDDGQQSVIKRELYEIAGFPNVVGVIDCTHVQLKAPSMNDYAFVHQSQKVSLNKRANNL